MTDKIHLYTKFKSLSTEKQSAVMKSLFKMDNTKQISLYVEKSISENSNEKQYEMKIFYVLRPKSSWQLTSWIIQYSSLPATAKLVSAQISVFYNVSRGTCFPTFNSLQKATGLSRGTINASIRKIQESREWIVIKPGLKRANQYIPNIPNFTQPNYSYLPDELLFKDPSGKYDKSSLQNNEKLSFERIDNVDDCYEGIVNQLDSSYPESDEEELSDYINSSYLIDDQDTLSPDWHLN